MHVESLIVPGIVFSFVLRDVLDLEAIFSPFPGQQMKKSNVSNRKRHFIHICRYTRHMKLEIQNIRDLVILINSSNTGPVYTSKIKIILCNLALPHSSPQSHRPQEPLVKVKDSMSLLYP